MQAVTYTHLESCLPGEEGGEHVGLLAGGHAHRVGDDLRSLLLRDRGHRGHRDLDLCKKGGQVMSRSVEI